MLITDEYRRLNADLHQRAVFGQRGARHRLVVLEMLAEYGASTVVDYGCGRGDLATSLTGIAVTSYDPAVERFSKLPEPADIVVCTDVLEHIEPDCLDDILRHLAELTLKAAHVVIATKLDGHKKLADGRDPHLIIQPPEWWRSQLARFMQVRLLNVTERDCTFRAWPL